MRTAYTTPEVAIATAATADLDADLLVLTVFEDDDLRDEADLDAATGGEIARARARGEFKGKLYDLFLTTVAAPHWKTRRALLVGAGRLDALTLETLRRVAIAAGLTARRRQLARLAIVQRPHTPLAAVDAVQVLVEGVCLSNFEPGSHKTDAPERSWLSSVVLRVPDGAAGLEAGVTRGRVLGECSNHARLLANEPGNTLTPQAFADRAAELARGAGLAVDVLDEQRIAELKMGMLLGVARGSQEPPRLVALRHDPKHAVPGVVLGLVGKGVTFDTGGISIKPAENMDRMKDDMSGGAAVICALTAIARLNVPVRCVGVVPMVENMPGGRAIKPGDVLHSAEGKTVEILNTDAEGRLILGDALWYARQLGATHLVDVATLTGACVVALGKTTSGLFGRPDGWVAAVQQASARAGDRSWPLPVHDDYMEQLKSDVADFSNTGGRAGGAITAALFIKAFAGDLPWVHMDIAGTAWADDATAYQPKGPTGVAVRTLVELALEAGAWSKLDPRS